MKPREAFSVSRAYRNDPLQDIFNTSTVDATQTNLFVCLCVCASECVSGDGSLARGPFESHLTLLTERSEGCDIRPPGEKRPLSKPNQTQPSFYFIMGLIDSSNIHNLF